MAHVKIALEHFHGKCRGQPDERPPSWLRNGPAGRWRYTFAEAAFYKENMSQRKASDAEIQEESRRIRRLQLVVQLVTSVISEGNLPLEEASELVASAKRAALALFPDRESTYDLIYHSRLQRVMREIYRIC